MNLYICEWKETVEPGDVPLFLPVVETAIIWAWSGTEALALLRQDVIGDERWEEGTAEAWFHKTPTQPEVLYSHRSCDG